MTQQAASKTSNADCTRHCLRYLSTLCLFIVALLTTTAQAHAAQTQQPGITQSPISENSIAVLPPRQASQYDAPQSDNPSLLQRRITPSRPPPPARRTVCKEEPRRCSTITRGQAARVRVRRGPARGSDHEVQLRHVAAASLAAPRRGEAPKHNITKKTQSHTVTTPDNTVIPQHKTSYDVNYAYAGSQPHAPTQIAGSDTVFKGGRSFTYDSNGNQTGWATLQSNQNRQITWDEENRVQEISDNGSTTEFKYDDSGERVIKRSAQGETAYVNQFFTVRNRTSGTKHVFIGESRMASTVVSGVEPAATTSTSTASTSSSSNGKGNGTSNGKANGAGNGNGNTVTAAASAKEPKDNEENFLFFYHPDHVGSTSYVTDKDGEIYQHVQYFPFGETWVEETSSTEKLPYLFTSKELDEETGLYYFGARYYDPRTSVWQSTDPALPSQLSSFGMYNPTRLGLYTYAAQRPTRLVDPDGRDFSDYLRGLKDEAVAQGKAALSNFHEGQKAKAQAIVEGRLSDAAKMHLQESVERVKAPFKAVADIADFGDQFVDAVAADGDYEAGRKALKPIGTAVSAVTTGTPGAGTAAVVKGAAGGAALKEALKKSARKPSMRINLLRKSKAGRGGSGNRGRGGRGRLKDLDAAGEQLDSITEHKKRLPRRGRAREGQKIKEAIGSTRKSEQRYKNSLKDFTKKER